MVGMALAVHMIEARRAERDGDGEPAEKNRSRGPKRAHALSRRPRRVGERPVQPVQDGDEGSAVPVRTK